MAVLDARDVAKYRDFGLWLLHELPQLPIRKEKVWRAFLRQAGDYAGTGIMALGGPLIRVEDDILMQCEDDGAPSTQADGSVVQNQRLKHYGFTVPTRGVNEIYIARDLAAGALSRQIQPVLEATVLHELVHWCRKVDGEDVYDENPPYAFEREAYGQVVRRTWPTCGPKPVSKRP
jgi:hypothetical protein